MPYSIYLRLNTKQKQTTKQTDILFKVLVVTIKQLPALCSQFKLSVLTIETSTSMLFNQYQFIVNFSDKTDNCSRRRSFMSFAKLSPRQCKMFQL